MTDYGTELKTLLLWPKNAKGVSKVKQSIFKDSSTSFPESSNEDESETEGAFENENIKIEELRLKNVMDTMTALLKRNDAATEEGEQLVEKIAAKVQLNKRTEMLLRFKAERIAMMLEQKAKKMAGDKTPYRKIKKRSFMDARFDPMLLTRQKVLAILLLALHYTKGDVQLGDIIRWIQEGHLSYYKVTDLFPQEMQFSDYDSNFTKPPTDLRHRSLTLCLTNLADMMRVKQFPTQDFLSLAERYLLELQLPAGLMVHVGRLMAECHLASSNHYVCCEGVAMGFVIVVLKTLLGLDGQTEHRISDVAKEINSLLEEDDTTRVKARLFVWDDWVRYIECRKAVIFNVHFPTKHKHARDLVIPPAPFLSFYSQHELKYRYDTFKTLNRDSRTRAHRARNDKMKVTIEKLPDQMDYNTYDFAPSLTPFVSYLEEILSREQSGDDKKLAGRVPDLLRFDHTATSVKYLIKPHKWIKLAAAKGVKIVVQKSRVFQETVIVRAAGTRIKGPRKTYAVVGLVNDDDSDHDGNLDASQHVKNLLVSNLLKRKADCLFNQSEDSQLVNGDDCVPKKKKDKKRNCSNVKEPVAGAATRILYQPSSEYWSLSVSDESAPTFFETRVEPLMPATFSWLLKECCNMVEMKPNDLYAQVLLVEQLASKKISVDDLKVVCPRPKFI